MAALIPIVIHPLVITDDFPLIPKNDRLRIGKSIYEKLGSAPLDFGKPLRKSLFGARSLRVGKYRVIYHVHPKRILILHIDHRRDVYDGPIQKRLQNFE